MRVIVMFSALLFESARKQLCYLHADMENEEWRNRHIHIILLYYYRFGHTSVLQGLIQRRGYMPTRALMTRTS